MSRPIVKPLLRRLAWWLFVAIAAYAMFSAMRYTYRWTQSSSSVREITTAHFVVSYRGTPASDAQEVADALEQNRARILDSLGVKDHPVVTVHLHPTQKDFEAASGWKGATGTSAGPRTVHLSWSRTDVQGAIHEFAHTVQLTRLLEYSKRAGWTDAEFEKRFAETYPRWLWESVSVYLAGETNRLGVWYLMRDSRRPALSGFTRKNNDIYFVGYTIPEYIVDHWGKARLAELVGSFGDVRVALGVDVAEFERGWQEFVAANYWTL